MQIVASQDANFDRDTARQKMQTLLGCPVGVALYVFRYMPDGRAISWPAGFRETVLLAAQNLDLPIFDPVPLVVEYGVEKALEPPLAHYSKEFLPVAGNALADFIQSGQEDFLTVQ